MIPIGDSGKFVDLEQIKTDLLNTDKSLKDYCFTMGFDESETEEVEDLLSGEVEKCTNCRKWNHSYDINYEGNCNKCLETQYL